MVYLYVLLIAVLLFLLLLLGIYIYTFAKIKPRKLNGAYMQKKLKIKPHLKLVLENIHKFSMESFEEVQITSHDGTLLCANYYESKPGAPLVIFFHGYRSSFDRDGSGGFWHLVSNGYNILMVHQRSHGKSGGKTITFGVKERYDCLSWIDYVVERFGENVKIMLMGVSMGASTVLMASGLNPPENVKGIIADCGFTSPEKIIKSEIGAIHLPKNLVYSLARLSAKIFGGFDPNDADACEAVSKTDIPILIIHGEDDSFVPYYMAKEILDSCKSDKMFLSVPGAGHAMSFYQDKKTYINIVDAFMQKLGP